MRKGKILLKRTDDSRRAAAKVKPEKKRAVTAGAGDTVRLLHELEEHQIELKMQNEELRAARATTEASLARYAELFEFAPIGYATLKPDGTIEEINQVGASLLGQSWLNQPGARLPRLATFVAPDDRSLLNRTMEQTLAAPGKHACEVTLAENPETFDRGSLPTRLRMTMSALRRSTPMILCAFEDVTQQRHREMQLAQAEEELREADRRKNEFMGALSHELRNPLAPIRNSLYLLARVPPGSEPAGRALTIIDRQVTHLSRLVDDLLDVTRIARGKIQLQRERIDLSELLARTVEDHRTSFERSGIRLETRFEPGPFYVDADPARLVQIASNLLGNAEKFTPRDGRVTVSLERHGAGVVFGVRDTGAGLDPGVLRHLFEPFAQAPQTMERSRGGLGLGLAMVKGLVELHGGSAGISSDGPGHGTLVTIELPMIAPPKNEKARSEQPRPRQRRVLVIEDSQDGADSLSDALRIEGHTVKTANDGPTGLGIMRDFRPEIVLCDVGLPGMDGYQVVHQVRSDPELSSTYMVALTGYALPEDQRRATEAGFDVHMAKPPNMEGLSKLLAQAPGV
jgi:signal transduction histidine kinase/CheY-like chemotaxis protein